ncbi:MAG: nucleotide-binding protein [Deltaproteobacteria bacterium]|nr:nucleotide-binding protein [Deltaproteobacteria bacterium]
MCEITVWTQGIFELTQYTLDSLIDSLDDFDFGIFVFSPDDIIIRLFQANFRSI